MIGVFAGAMTTVMALVLFTGIIPLGSVNPILASAATTLIMLLGLAFVARCLFDRTASVRGSMLHWFVLAFVAYAFGRYYFSPYEHQARLELIQILLCAIIFFVSSSQFSARQDRTVFVSSLMFLALFQSGFALWQVLTESDAIFHWERPEIYSGRGSGTYVCPNHLAGFLEMALGLIVARAAILRREGKSIERTAILKVIAIYVALMTVVGIGISFSRAGWFSTAVSVAALLFLGGWKSRSILSKVGLVLVIAGIAVLMFWTVEPVRNYLQRSLVIDDKSETISLADKTLGGRTLLWKTTFQMVRDNPIAGTGIGSWQWVHQRYEPYRNLSFADYTHNDYLQLASDYGLVGFALMLGVFVAFFRRAWKIAATTESSEHRAFAVGAMMSTIAILVHSWFDFNLHIPANSFVLAAIFGFTAAIPLRKAEAGQPVASFLQRGATAVAGLIILGYVAFAFVPTARAFHHTQLGHLAKADLEYEVAEAQFRRAIEIDARNPSPYVKSGDAFRDQASWRFGPSRRSERIALAKKAVERYAQALALNPAQSDVWVGKARAHELLEDDPAVLDCLRKAIEAAPANPYPHFELGRYYRQRGEDEKALESFKLANRYFLYNDPMFGLNAWEMEQQIKSRMPPDKQP